MTVEYMREAIASVYDGKAWKQKVKNMPEYQVIAVYHKFLDSGKFNKKQSKSTSNKPEQKEVPRQFEHYSGVQLTMDDLLHI